MSKPADVVLNDPSLKGCLPSDFMYGAASASHQIEGCISADGKGVNVWDVILKDKKGENGEDACNSYEQWKEDVALIKKYGMNTYRFSISWARIRPKGGRDDPVNEAGIKYYSDLIDALLAEGITPAITVFHWDHPQHLEDAYGSFFNEKEIIEDFVAFAKVLFERLGDRCKFWITINEPHIFTLLTSMTYKADVFDHDADYARMARTLLLCHAKTVDLYRREFQPKQQGTIGITLNADWPEPLDESAEARDAAQNILHHNLSLYADPVYLGSWPEYLKKEYGKHAPEFSEEEWKLVKGSSDFFGLNHYGTSYATGTRIPRKDVALFRIGFGHYEQIHEKDGKVIGNKGTNGHPYDVPWGFRKLLHYISHRYTKATNTPIIITENGFPVIDEGEMTTEQAIQDTQRQQYYAGYVRELMLAYKESGVLISGYMAWSLLDNLEWHNGYGPRFGITVVERDNGFKRTPKGSAYALKEIFEYAMKK